MKKVISMKLVLSTLLALTMLLAAVGGLPSAPKAAASTPAEICPDEYRASTHTDPYWEGDPEGIITIWTDVHFVNYGPGDAYNVIATLTYVPFNAKIIGGVVDVGDIPAGPDGAWGTNDFSIEWDMTNKSDERDGWQFQLDYDDVAGNHYTVRNVPKFCGEQAIIGDFVWIDTDKDGIQDDGEVGLANVEVNLYDNQEYLVATTATDTAGYYSFTVAAPGMYYVEFVAPEGCFFTDKDQGADDIDSDADMMTGMTDEFVVYPFTEDVPPLPYEDMTRDAGLWCQIPNEYPLITIEKTVDCDGDGVYSNLETCSAGNPYCGCHDGDHNFWNNWNQDGCGDGDHNFWNNWNQDGCGDGDHNFWNNWNQDGCGDCGDGDHNFWNNWNQGGCGDGKVDCGCPDCKPKASWMIVVTNAGDGAVMNITVTDTNGKTFGPFDLPNPDDSVTFDYFTCPTVTTTNTAAAQGLDQYGNQVGPVYDDATVEFIVPNAGISIEKTVDCDGDGVYSDLETCSVCKSDCGCGDGDHNFWNNWNKGGRGDYKPDCGCPDCKSKASWKIVVTNTGDSAVMGVIVTDTNGKRFGPFGLANNGDSKEFVYTTCPKADTTNTATAQGKDQFCNVVGPVSDDAAIEVIVSPCGEATRTPGFWKNRLDFTTYIFTEHLGSDINIGWRDITNVEDLMGILWANKARNSDRTKRTRLCQAKERAAFQAVAAILNTGLPNGAPIPVSLADIQTILSGSDVKAIRSLARTLDRYNNSGDKIPIDSPVPIGKAQPKLAKAAANIPFADCP